MNIGIAIGVPFLSKIKKVVSDSFNRPNNTSSLGVADSGQTWQSLAGTWGINSNQAYVSTGVSASLNLATIPAFSDFTGYVYFTFQDTEGGFLFRTKDSNNFLMAYVRTDSLILYKKVAGVAKQIGSYAFTATAGTTYKISVSAIGSNINVSLNDALRISVTETDLQTNSNCGLYIYTSTTISNSRLDNLKVIST